jgi:L-amino acid N-acyltransferase YncA
VTLRVRAATPHDSEAIARIYNQGIEERTATFETRLRSAADIEEWFDGEHPICVVEDGLGVSAFAASSTYRPRDCYRGVAEISVYVDRAARGQGAGKLALTALIAACEARGFWKLLSRVFLDNQGSRGLVRALGFREVGVYERHARHQGAWRDVVIVEKLIGEGAQ